MFGVDDMALASVGSSIVGGLFGSNNVSNTNAANAQEAQLNRDFQAQQAQINRDWQTDMSNTAYQRRTKDLVAAGLNPMLAVAQGGAQVGAPIGVSGAQATMQNNASGIASAAQQVANTMLTGGMVDKLAAETELIRSQITNTNASTSERNTNVQVMNSAIAETKARIDNLVAQTSNEQLKGPMITAQTALASAQAELAKSGVLTAATQQTLNNAMAGLARQNINVGRSQVVLNDALAGQSKQATDTSLAQQGLTETQQEGARQNININKPLESFAGTSLGGQSPTVQLLMQVLKATAAAIGRH